MKAGITYEAILSLSLEDIAQSFPHGAREVTKGRFEPADEEGATKTLRSLLRTKKDGQENKPLVYEAILDMPQDEFEWRFPNGIRAIKDRHEDRPEFKWRAAEKGERPHKTFAQLQADRKQHSRMKPLRYMHRRSHMGYTDQPHMALEKAPAADADVLKEYAVESRNLHELRRAGEHERRLAQQHSLERQLTEAIEVARERGVDVHADIQFIKRRLERMKQKLAKAA